MPPENTFSRSSGDITTTASATATRRVAGLSPTSTIRAAPDSSRCVRSLIPHSPVLLGGEKLQQQAVPRLDLVNPHRHDCKTTVRRRAGQEDAALATGRHPFERLLVLDPCAQEVLLRPVAREGLPRHPPHPRPEQGVRPLHRQEGGTGKLLEGHEDRDRVAREPEEGSAAHHPETERLARVHRQ